jgi:hypothetical protein
MDTELYTIKSTCYNHENMDFCPVLVQISNEIQKFHNGAKFLLQVWTKDNKKIYEKPLRCKNLQNLMLIRGGDCVGCLLLVLPVQD